MNIYIGNLHPDISETEVTRLFQAFGSVHSVSLIMERNGNRSKGFGFVTMEHYDEAQKAMQALDNTSYMARCIEVSEAMSG